MDDTQPQLTNFVSEDSVVTGGILSRDDLEILGTVEGVVRCNARVYVRDGATVCGPIHAREIYVEGLVQGPLHAYRRARVLDRGVVIGDVYGSSLIIDAGGQHRGKLCRPTPPPRPVAESVAAVSEDFESRSETPPSLDAMARKAGGHLSGPSNEEPPIAAQPGSPIAAMPTPPPLPTQAPAAPQKRLPRRFVLSSHTAGVLKSSRTSICGEISLTPSSRPASPARTGNLAPHPPKRRRVRPPTPGNLWPEPWPSLDSRYKNG